MNIRLATVTSTSAAAMSTSLGPTPQTTPPPPRTLLASATESFVLGIDTCGFTSGSTRKTAQKLFIVIVRETTAAAALVHPQTVARVSGRPAAAIRRAPDIVVRIRYAGPASLSPMSDAAPAPCTARCTHSPELMPTTSADDHPSATELTVSPIDTSGSSSDKSQTSPTGAIVGAIVGGVLLVALAIVAFVLLAKRRRRKREQQLITKELISGPTDHSPTIPEKSGGGNLRTRLRLSTIPEQNSPLPTSPMLSRYKSSRRSYGPDWPLGSADPLESHPVLPGATPITPATVDLEKRLSEPRGGSVPQLQIPAIPAIPAIPEIPTIHATRLSPAPPPKSPAGASPQQQQHKPRTPSASSDIGLLQSPRLSFALPASPIDAAFNVEVARRVSLIDGAAAAYTIPVISNVEGSRSSSNRNSSNPWRESNIRASTRPPPRSSVYQPRDDASVSPLERSPERRGSGSVADPKRLSLVSAPSIGDSRFVEAADDLVSPVSPEDEEGLGIDGTGRGGRRNGLGEGKSCYS
ncbi:hypothetical protein PG995_000590 [Apiospora arundinis]